MAADRRWRALFGAAAVCVVCACGQDGAASPPADKIMTTDPDASTEALMTALEKAPGRPVRVIVTVRADAIDAVADMARRAGASHVERLAGQPLLVIEGLPEHLRQVLRSGKVVRMQRDDAAPTN